MRHVPAGWETKTLDQVVELRRGFDLPTHSRRGGSYPVLSAGVTAGWHDEGPIKGPGFVVGRATNLGIPTWSDGDYWPLNTTLYAADFHGHSPRFVFHLFESMDLSGFDSGSVQPMLNRNYIAKLKVMVPPIGEQVAIAEVLGALDDKIAANRKLAETAESLLAARFEALGMDVAPDDGEAVSITDYFDFNPSYPKPAESEPIYVDMKKLPTSSMTIADWEARPSKGGARFTNGDTLLARITPCLENRKTGYVDFLEEDQVAIGSTEYIVIRSKTGVPLELSYFLAISERFRTFAIRHMVGTSGRQRLSAKDLESYVLRAIDPSRLESWGAVAAPIVESLAVARDETRTLTTLRDTLLPRLMSGELRVRDAEREVEAAL